MKRRLPAEWEPQDGILLAWPHVDSDWCDNLDAVQQVFVAITMAISHFEAVLIVAPDTNLVQQQLDEAGIDQRRIHLVQVPTNDTWARDFGPITVLENDAPLILDFGFNAWGLKFAADLDNQITGRLAGLGAFGATPVKIPGLVLEGGSIESNGAGTLLTTSDCLLSPNRNPHLDQRGIEELLADQLGAHHFLWLNHGYLAGDDTDSHIDTLARLCPNDTIAYVRCDDAEDEHYPALAAMESELHDLRTPQGTPYKLVALPWPKPCFAQDGHRIPATYANFLVINGAVLVPTYNDPQDTAALKILTDVFSGREIIGIDCRPLIAQHGSLHCVTMQLPRGVLP
ncbi:MAG: agmatine deiminase family protein [Desulfobulbus sp.]|nr:agmatine deiminase family protein [Desulfobulbus sp.]